MGILRQFCALLWKNYVLRKRKPVFLLLEVLWPVIIFVAIALVRRGVPPVPRESCHYQERALPSAGLLPFLQTAVCTLNNPCISQQKVEEKNAAQERLRSMLYKVEPYIRKNTTLTAFEVLPTVAKVVNTLKTKLNDTVLENFEDRLLLKNLLRDEEKILDLVVNKYALLTDQQAQDLLDSSLNPYQLVKTLGDIDFKGVACDKAKLTKYVFFPKHTDVAAVSQSLCDIDEDLISNITNEIVRQIDIANLIRFGEEFANFMGEFDYAVLFGDLADLAEVYINKSGLLAAITDLPDLSVISKVLDKFAKIIPTFQSLGTIDMKSISALYDLVAPLMETYVTDKTILNTIRNMIGGLKDWTTPIDATASDIDWRKLINMTASLSEVFNSFENMSFISHILDTTDFNSIYELMISVLSGNNSDAAVSTVQGMNAANMAGLENLMRSLMSNTTVNMMMEVMYKVSEMLMDTMVSYKAMDSELRYFVTIDHDIMGTNVMNIFVMMGPEKTSAFITEILKPTNYEPLMLGKIDAKSLCENVTDKIYSEEPQATAQIWKAYICSVQIIDRFERLSLKSVYQDNKLKMEESMQDVSYVVEHPETIVNPVTMATVYTKMSEMSNLTTYMMMENSREWAKILSDLPYSSSDTGDEKSWGSAWYNASSAMVMTIMMTSMKQIGETMQGTELWQYMMPSAIAMEAYMAAQAEPYRMMQDMVDVSTSLGMMVENMEYMPEVLSAMLTFMNSEEGKKDMEGFYANPLNAICEDNFLYLLNVSDKVPISDIQKSVCDTDWQQFGQELIHTMDWMGSMQKKIDIYNYNGTTSTVDWDRMLENMEIYMTAMTQQKQVMKDFEYIMNKMNFTRLLEELGAMDQYGLKNFTVTDVNNTVTAIVSGIEGLDKSLVNNSFWNYAKHVATLWMAYTNIASDVYTHMKDSINIADYIKTMSPTLGDYFQNVSTLSPNLFEYLTKSLQNPQTLLSAALNNNWDKLCNGTKLSDILHLRASEAIQEFEHGLCQLNWTAVLEEIMEYNPNIRIYSDELIILSGSIDETPPIAVDWRQLSEDTMEFIQNLQDWIMSNNSRQVQGIDTKSLNMTLGDFIDAFTRADQWDTAKFGLIAEEMMKLFSSQGDHDGNSTMWDLVIQSSMLQVYVSHHFLKFVNLQLDYINTTDPVDLKKYLNSEEANKIFHVLQVSSQVNAALISNFKEYATDPQKITYLLSSNLSSICNDEASFSKMFTVPPASNLTVQDLQDTVCGVNLNVTKLVSELEKSVHGLTEFLDAMTKVETMAVEGLQKEDYVNITEYTAEIDRYSKLLTDILSNPPNITVFWARPDDDMSWLMKQLEDLANFTTSGFENQDITTTFGTIQQHIGKALSEVVQSSPEMGKIMYIADAYLRTLEKLYNDRNGLWDHPRNSLAGYPEMLKVWNLMEKIPELYETFQYTLTYDNKKISTFVSLMLESFDKLCAADPDTLMTVPANSSFSFSQFMSDLCDVNITLLDEESYYYSGRDVVDYMYATVDNITEPTNITAMFIRLDELYGTLVETLNDTSILEMKLPRFLDIKVWEEIFSRSGEILANSTMNTVNETAITAQIMESIDELQKSMPNIRPYLNVLDLYLSVVLQNSEQQLAMRQDPSSAFMDFPEMRKLWLLMDYLPELYQTYYYTSLIAQDKISNFTSTLISGFESLCAADPANLMTVPPGLDFDFVHFHQKLCDVNLTILAEESMRYNSQQNITAAYENFNNLTNLVNLNDFAKRINDLMRVTTEVYNFTDISSGDWPRFLNFTLWSDIMAAVSNWTMDPEILKQLASNSNSLLSVLSGVTMSEEEKTMLRTMEAVNMLMETFLDKMEGKNGTKEILTLEDFFTSSTEVLKLVRLVQKPGMMEILVYASNNPQVSAILTNPNTSGAIDELCAKDWVELLNLPAKYNVNFTALQEEFCILNFTAFMPELYREFKIQDMLDKIASNDSVDWQYISEQNQKFSQRISNLIASPPTFELPAHWTNETVWTQLFTAYSESMSNLSSLVGSTLGNSGSLLTQLTDMAMSEEEKSMLRTMEAINMLVGTVLDKLETKNGTDVIYRLEDFFASSVEILKLVHLIQKPGMMEIFVYSSNNPQFSAIYMNINTTDIIDDLCALNWMQVLRLPEKKDVNFTALQEEFCAVNFSAILPEFYEEFNLQAVIDKISSNDTVDWKYITKQNERLNERINKLISSPPKFDLPPHWTNETVWNDLFTAYSQLITNMSQIPDSASLVDQIFTPLNNEDINKVGAIVDILMDVVIKRLEDYPDEITLDYLLNNNTQLKVLIDVLNALSYNGAKDFNDGNIDVFKLLSLAVQPSKLEEACKNGTFTSLISKNKTVSDTAVNIEEVLCMDTHAVYQALMDFQDTADIQDKIMKILNGSDPVSVDWKSVGSKVDSLIKLFTGKSAMTPMMSVKLTELFNINNTLPMLQSIFTNPSIIGQMTGAFKPIVDKQVLDILHPIVAQMVDMMNLLQEKNVTVQSLLTNPDMLNDVLNSFNTFNTQMGTYVKDIVKPAIEHAATIGSVQSTVCDISLLEEQSKIVPTMGVSVNRISQALCGKDRLQWFDSLLEANFTQTELIGVKELLESFYNRTDSTERTWEAFTKTVSDVVERYRNFLGDMDWENTGDGVSGNVTEPEPFNLNNFMNQTLRSFIGYMKILESDQTVEGSLQELKQFFTSMSNIQDFVNEQLEKAREVGKPLNLVKLLPDAELMAKIVTGIQSEEYTAIITLMSLFPDKVLQIYKNHSWEEVACSPSKFYEDFQFETGYDSESLRKSICDVVQKNSSIWSDLLNNVQMTDLISELNDWLLGQDTTPVSAGVWDELLRTSEQFMKNVLELQNIDVQGLISYGETLLKHMGELSTLSTDSYTGQCESALKQFYGTELYDKTLLPILNSVYLQTHLQYKYSSLFDEMLDVVCEEPASNITRLVDLLKMSSVTEKIQQITELTMGTQNMTFSCKDMVNVSILYAEAMNRSFTIWAEIDGKHSSCLDGQMKMMLDVLGDVTKLFEVSKVLLREVNNPDFRKFITTIAGNENILQVMEYILQGFVQQQNWVEETNKKIQSNITELENYIQDILGLSPNVIESLMNATLSKNVGNLTAEELMNALCSDSLSEPADKFLSYFNSTLRDAIGIDCDQDWNITYDIVSSLLTLSKLAEQLQTNIALEDVSWWMGLSQDLAELASGLQGLSELAGFLDKVNYIDINNIVDNGELLVTIQRLLIDSGPESLTDNVNQVLARFGELNEDSQQIFKDMQILTKGLLSFTTLRRLIISNVQIKDLLKDVDQFQQFLTDSMDIPLNVAQAIVDGSLSFELLINASKANITDWVCESDKLEDILNVTGSQLDYKFISETFCSLDTDTIADILQEVFNQLDIGDLAEEFLTRSITEILAEAETSKEDVQDALEALGNANADLKEVIDEFGDYAVNMTDAIRALAEAQIGTTSSSSLSSLICGESMSNIDDEFSLSGSLPTAETLTEEQKEEMEELKAESTVCEQLYLDIMSASGGPIIWGYLKPIMRGKILFSPNNDITRNIIEKINATFAMITDFQKDASKLSSGATSLKNITSGDTNLVKLLSSPLVESFISQFSDSSESGFDDLVYILNNSSTDLIRAMSNAASFMGDYIHCIELDRFVGYDNEADLEWAAAKLASKNNLLAGIVFMNAEENIVRRKRDSHIQTPSHLMYKIRMDIDNVQHTQRIKDRIWRPQSRDEFADDLRYLRGFLQLQDMIDSAFIESMTGTEGTKVLVATKQFPFPCYKRDTFLNALIAYLLPVMMTFAWLAGLALATYNLVLDREDGQEETLRAMGLMCCINWWAWFISTMCIMAVVSVVVTIISHYAELMPHSNFAIIFLYFLDFCFSATMLCYFVSAFFTRTSIAILVTLIVYFVSYIPYVILLTLEIQMTFWQKSLACLSSTSAFGFAAQYLAWYEEQQIGIHWDNIGTSAIVGDPASFSWCCIMMVIDGGIYLILGWYVRSVKPGKYGVSEPWYFPLSPSYWCSCFTGNSGTEDKYRADEQGDQFEADASGSPKVICVRGLSKEYKKGKPVVSDLNMDIYAGQVTTLLGYNGAAKTTTMNMLTGLLEPTSGVVSIFNRPLKNMKSSLGICPQNNALYQYMTVKEHMEFVQSVKGCSSQTGSREEIRQILEEVNLWHCRHCNVQQLSGGMQRRLCVALAFVGNSKAVILDEPTSGVDPSGRRAIWNLIIRKKGAIGVLLSTHHLDEAEVISDKVCILHEGKLLCSGTPLYLKEKFTSGHRVTVETVAPERSAITRCIQHYVPNAVLQSTTANEMTFVLPTSNHNKFYDLFHSLEERQEELQIASFGISDPMLEEVFLTVCKTYDRLDTDRDETSEVVNIASTLPTVPLPEVRYNTGFTWKMQQFSALFVKRFHHYRRNWRLFLSAILLPVLLFVAASGLHTVRPDHAQNSLLLSPVMYGPDSYFFVNDHSSGQEALSVYDTFLNNPGIGTTCMENMEKYRENKDWKCIDPDTSYSVPDYTYNPNASCSCNNYKYSCTQGSATAPPRQWRTTTGDILQNFEGRNTETYLFESFEEFMDKRFGGYSFVTDTSSDGTQALKSTVWFNNKGYHSLPSFYTGLSNAVLRSRAQTMKNGDPQKYGITTFNHPFTFNTQQLSKDTILQSAADLGIAATIMLAFTFIPVGIVMYSVGEYINKEKHLQFTSGIGPALYWFTSFFWDLIILVLTTALVFAVMAIFRHDSFWARHNAAGTVVLILLYGWATLPLVYCTTKLFNAASTAFLTMFCVLNFIGLVPICAMFVLNFYQYEEIIYDAYVVCQKVFLIFPTYALGAGLIDIMTNQIKTNIFARFGTDVYVDPFTFDLLGWNYVFLAIEGLVFFIFAVLIDVFSRCKCDLSSMDIETERFEDDDVQEEIARLCHRGNNEDSLIARNISKVYKRAGNNFLAVDHVTFGVSQGECFGLLGVNGAGKTTTFKIITGSLNATEGSIFFRRTGYQKNSTVQQNMGYCPQEEALDSFLTVREMLEFYGRMRGLDGQTRKTAIRNVIENLKLEPILKKTVRTCSGGMKRKLSLAIALLGDPAFILLDEPTTGMDPVAKRLAWNCIKMAKSKGQTIVLTSHSMEECDVLCSRLSILVNGQMKCLGSPQHLKNKFGDTYTIMLHVSGPLARSGKIYELVQDYFPGASIRDHHLDVIQLDISRQTITVSEIIRILEKEKKNYNILYYTVSQNTLETIFLNFVREQHDSETEGTGSSDRSSDVTIPVDEESKLAGKHMPHTRYGYMNRAYEGFGELPVSPTKKMVDPYPVTAETDDGYVTKM